MPSIDRNSAQPLYQQVYEQIAEGIESGLYVAGRKLPSIRECARNLDISNTTVELAYQKLMSEGYISARRGSGYTICSIESATDGPARHFDPDYQKSLEQLKQAEMQLRNAKTPRYDFAYDEVDRTLFPYSAWGRISRDVFFAQGAENACLYNDPHGLYSLRQQIAQYVGGEHDIACTPEQILVMTTTRNLIASITGLFDPSDTRIVMENPGYDEVALELCAQGFDVSWLTVSPYPSFEDAAPLLKGAKLLFATPSCQFPTNHPMPLDIRRKLVNWACENDAYLIDDEYGWEYLAGMGRKPTLATLDHSGRVITMGTFSNTLSPAMGLSYAILPPKLMLRWHEKHRDSHPQAPWQTQAAMAAFMSDNHWRTHIRRVRTAMIRKRAALLDAINTHFADEVEVVAGPSSLYVLIRTLDGRDEESLVAAAREKGIEVYPTNRYWHGSAPTDWRYVLVGYAGILEADIEPSIRGLAEAWGYGRNC